MRMKFLPVYILMAIAIALSGCDQQKQSEGISVSLGTYTNSEGKITGTTVLISADDLITPPDGFPVDITGPNGISYSIRIQKSVEQAYWAYYIYGDTPRSGKYSVSITTSKGEVINHDVELDALDYLKPPMSIIVSSAGQGKVTVSWSRVNGAKSYLVYVYNGTRQEVVKKWYTTDESITYTDHILNSGDTYIAYVNAYSLNLTKAPVDIEKQFNESHNGSGEFILSSGRIMMLE